MALRRRAKIEAELAEVRTKLEQVEARSTLQRVKAEGDVTFTPALLEMLSLFDGTSASYGVVYRKLPPVRTVVDFIADAVSTTPLKFYRRLDNNRPEEREHRVARLLRKPGPGLTTRTLVWGTVADLAVYARAYWRYIAPTRTQGEALVPLPPFRVTPRGGDLVEPAVYEFWPPGSGQPILYGRDEIIDFHTYDPEDRRIGSSKLAALKAILQEEVEASRNRSGFWLNSARQGGFFEFPENVELTPNQLALMRESMQEAHSGSQNAGKWGIVPRGGKANPVSFSPKESEFLEGRKFVLEATARVFNVPLSLLGLTETATYASQREFRRQLYTEVLPPWYEIIQSEIELQLFPWFTDTEDLYPEFEVESKLRGDFLEQAEVLGKALGGGSTPGYMVIAEVRKLLNLPEIDDPRADELIVPLNVQVGPTPPAPAQPALAVVASMPEERLRHQLLAFLERQERSVATKAGAGEPFDHERWNGELAEITGGAIAERLNLQIAVALHSKSVPEVFADVRARVPYIVQETLAATKEA